MAGAQDDNNRQHYKKPQNRQDYNANAKRKNSIAGKNKDLHNNTLSASGTVTSSPTTPTSTSSNTSFAGPGPALPSLKPTIEHVPVNSFNSQEVSNYLNNTWKETLDRYHDNNLSEAEKPEMYKSTEKAWVAKGGPAWGNKGNLMASGNDFFAELRKSSLVQVSNAQPATANIKRTSNQRRTKFIGKNDRNNGML